MLIFAPCASLSELCTGFNTFTFKFLALGSVVILEIVVMMYAIKPFSRLATKPSAKNLNLTAISN